jgi:hypothetical protein
MKSLKVLARQAVLYSICCQLVWPQPEGLSQLSQDFWNWRAQEQPFSGDDIPRLERPAGVAIDWSPQSIQQKRLQLAAFEARWKILAPSSGATISQQVDYRLIGSALARVGWELDIEQGWKRNPAFYIDQALGAMYLLLLPPPPFDASRQAEIVHRLETVPATIRAAKANLTDMRAPFAQLAIDALASGARTAVDEGDECGVGESSGRSGGCVGRLPEVAQAGGAETAEGHGDRPGELSVLSAQHCHGAVHTGTVARNEPTGVEQVGSL